MPEADLIIRIRVGDPDAAAVLVRRYYDEYWQFAYRMIGHRADAGRRKKVRLAMHTHDREVAKQKAWDRRVPASNGHQERTPRRDHVPHAQIPLTP